MDNPNTQQEPQVQPQPAKVVDHEAECKALAERLRTGYLNYKETGDESLFHDAYVDLHIAFVRKNKLASVLLGADTPWYTVFMATCNTNEEAKAIAIRHLDEALAEHDAKNTGCVWPNLGELFHLDFFENVVAEELLEAEAAKAEEELTPPTYEQLAQQVEEMNARGEFPLDNDIDRDKVAEDIRNSLNLFKTRNLGYKKKKTEAQAEVQPFRIVPKASMQNPYTQNQIEGDPMKIILVKEESKPEYTTEDMVVAGAAVGLAAVGLMYVGHKIFSKDGESVMKGVSRSGALSSIGRGISRAGASLGSTRSGFSLK